MGESNRRSSPRTGNEPPTNNHYVYAYGGVGGPGGEGRSQGVGGRGGSGEGPTFNYYPTSEHFTINVDSGQRNQHERSQIIDWLSPLNFFVRQADISCRRQAGTGEWLLDDSRFQRWKSSVAGVLWFRGIRACRLPSMSSVEFYTCSGRWENCTCITCCGPSQCPITTRE
ncbi:hypothetical protein K438DRAFT_1814765 [Mycena galopus ATCC 62051]|nr:hypothetical protein K438DRAFT_1814765 [Mycena galopus ATCC 62051]